MARGRAWRPTPPTSAASVPGAPQDDGEAPAAREHEGVDEFPGENDAAEAAEDVGHSGTLFPGRIGPREAAPPPARLGDALASLEKSDPAAARPLATLGAARADFVRIIAALPAQIPAEVRAAVDAVLERL